jgi:hypothetical protein
VYALGVLNNDLGVAPVAGRFGDTSRVGILLMVEMTTGTAY